MRFCQRRASLVKQQRLAACHASTNCCCFLIAAYFIAVQKRKSIKKIRLAEDLGEEDELDDMED